MKSTRRTTRRSTVRAWFTRLACTAVLGGSLATNAAGQEAESLYSFSDKPVGLNLQNPLNFRVDDLGVLEYKQQREYQVTTNLPQVPADVYDNHSIMAAPPMKPLRFHHKPDRFPHHRGIYNVGDKCDVRYFGSYEQLWVTREGIDRFSLSRGHQFDNFGSDRAGRYKAGMMLGCTEGMEIVYTGSIHFSRLNTRVGANLATDLLPGGGVTPAQMNTLNNAAQHGQGHTAEFRNYELNRRWWAGDVLSTLFGVRAIEYKEDYSLASIGMGGGQGRFLEDVSNLMFGLQIGGDFYYPMGRRLDFGLTGRAALMANRNRGRTFVSNAGAVIINNRDTDVDVAGMIEVGARARYWILPQLVAIAGAEAWFLPGVATIQNQDFYRITPTTGRDVDADDTAIFLGAMAGLEGRF